MIDRPRHDEQQVGQPVDIPDQKLMDGRLQRNHPPLGAAADRARKVERGARLGAAGQDEVRQRREGHLEPIDELLEALDIGILSATLVTRGEILSPGSASRAPSANRSR